MKITPIGTDRIKDETDKGNFDVYTLVGGGLQIHSWEEKTLSVGVTEKDAVVGETPYFQGAHKVVIREECV